MAGQYDQCLQSELECLHTVDIVLLKMKIMIHNFTICVFGRHLKDCLI